MLLPKIIITLFIVLTLIATKASNIVHAQNIDELQTQINSHTEEIRKLDEEIKKWEQEINIKTTEAKTLQNTIVILDANTKKISTEIKKTELSINNVSATITDLSRQINLLENRIDLNSRAIRKSLNELNKTDDISLVETLLGSQSMATALDQYETAERFHRSIQQKSIQLSDYKDSLQEKKSTVERERRSLVSLKGNLSDQKNILDINKKAKNTTLVETKNQESEFKKILAQRQAEKERFEKELFEFESRLKITIDPKSFASAQRGILSWPLDNIFITQPFGKTVDSVRLYVSGTHNGMDFRATRGTRVFSALSGIVEDIGNTDSLRGCYSYGKWILIKHNNGLSSLYAHLDLIRVSRGQSVETGDIIGYSGQSGYATGPHLHFTLYASQGVKIQRYSQSKNCKDADIPIASSNAYLDPMIYFPQI